MISFGVYSADLADARRRELLAEVERDRRSRSAGHQPGTAWPIRLSRRVAAILLTCRRATRATRAPGLATGLSTATK